MLQKYFIALIPPEPVHSEIDRIKKEVSEKYNNKSALRSPPHITLHMPFEYKTEKESALFTALENFSFTDKFNVQLNNYACFEPKVVFIDVVQNDTLSLLQSTLVQHIKVNLNIFNQAEALRGFHPHITIAFRDLKRSTFYEMMGEYKEKMYAANFNVDSFFLLKHTGKNWLPYKEFKFKV